MARIIARLRLAAERVLQPDWAAVGAHHQQVELAPLAG
jgi:hypothetical protein